MCRIPSPKNVNPVCLVNLGALCSVVVFLDSECMSAHYTVQDMSENNQMSCNIGICTYSSVVTAVILMLSVTEYVLFLRH